jgi:hypothetical protein
VRSPARRRPRPSAQCWSRYSWRGRLVSVELPVAANVERENPPTMLHLGGMMKSVVHKQVIEQVGRAMDRSGVLIDPNAETVGCMVSRNISPASRRRASAMETCGAGDVTGFLDGEPPPQTQSEGGSSPPSRSGSILPHSSSPATRRAPGSRGGRRPRRGRGSVPMGVEAANPPQSTDFGPRQRREDSALIRGEW